MEENKKPIKRPIQIFSSPDSSMGVNVVKSPVKLTILDMLKETDMEFDEITLNTGKSKSTISVHLKSLRENGIINYRVDPNDNRKKIFFLSSRYLGSVDIKESKEIEETTPEFLIENIINNKANFSLLLFHTLRSSLIQEGISINPFLHDTGYRIGEALYPSLKDDDLEKFIENIKEFWESNKLGELDIDLGQIIKVKNGDCFECGSLPKIGIPACYFDVGILEALFSKYFGMPLNVIETKCFTMGDNHCEFEIEPLSLEKIRNLEGI